MTIIDVCSSRRRFVVGALGNPRRSEGAGRHHRVDRRRFIGAWIGGRSPFRASLGGIQVCRPYWVRDLHFCARDVLGNASTHDRLSSSGERLHVSLSAGGGPACFFDAASRTSATATRTYRAAWSVPSRSSTEKALLLHDQAVSTDLRRTLRAISPARRVAFVSTKPLNCTDSLSGSHADLEDLSAESFARRT